MGRSGGGIRNQPLHQRPYAVPITVDDWSWFEPVAEELRLLSGASGSDVGDWRLDAAERLDALARQWEADAARRGLEVRPGVVATIEVAASDPRMLAEVGMELACEEDPRVVAKGAFSWRSIAGNDLAALSLRLREIDSRV